MGYSRELCCVWQHEKLPERVYSVLLYPAKGEQLPPSVSQTTCK